MNFITTQDRFQISLSSLEDKISVDNPVRFVDASVEHLDLFERIVMLREDRHQRHISLWRKLKNLYLNNIQ